MNGITNYDIMIFSTEYFPTEQTFYPTTENMKEKKSLLNSIQQNIGVHIAGFVNICLITVLILIVCFYKPYYNIASISDVFNLSMDILGTIVCTMLYYGCLVSGNTKNKDTVLYFFVLLIHSFTFLFDSLMWLIEGVNSLRLLNILVSTLFYASSFLLFYLFWRHACTVLKPEKTLYKRLDTIQKILLILSLFVCVINLFTPVIFNIDSDGMFHRAFGYSIGSIYISISFIILIVLTCRSHISSWRKLFVILPPVVSILVFILLWNNSKLVISYTVAIISMIIVNCILYGEKMRLKELIIRVFATVLLCTMLVYGPVIYRYSSKKAIDDGYNSVSRAFPLVARLVDEVSLDALCDPDNTDLYQETREKLRGLSQALDLQNLYVELIDRNEMTRSFVIVVAASDEEDSVIKETLGWPGASIWSEESYITDPELIVMDGGYTDTYSEQDNEYGHNLDWFYPYFDSNGNVVAILGADIDVGKQEATSIRQSLTDIAPAVALFFITLLVLIHIIDFKFLRPFYLISHHIQEFFKEGNKKNEKFSVSGSYEIWFLSKSFDFMTSELDEYEESRAREIQERQRISTELELSSSIQSQFLPNKFPPYPDRREFDIFASMKPAKEVAGDFYDFFFTAPDKFVIVIADVSGKGFPAALFMMRSKTAIRAVAEQDYSPSSILEKVNYSLCEGNPKKMFVTVWLGVIDLTTGLMKCSNAGHEYPMIQRPGGDYTLYEDAHSPLLGLKKKLNLSEYELKLEPGGTLFVYTDGIPEAMNSSEEVYGLNRLKNALNTNKEDSLEGILSEITKDIANFTTDAEQFDDITMLGFRYFGPTGRS